MSTHQAPGEYTTGRRYKLVRELGSGAFGKVYLADQCSNHGFRRPVALKVLRREASAESARRIRDEARLLGRINHPNVVQVLDLVQLSLGWSVVMEHVPGTDVERLAARLARRQEAFPLRAACTTAIGIADALHAVWHTTDDRGTPMRVVHRDIKPANVRVTPHGEVKVLDFGIATASQEREAKTRTAAVIGTLRYMAPERLFGEDAATKGDIYSLGKMFVQLLLGHRPARSPVVPSAHRRFVDKMLEEVRSIPVDAEPVTRLVELIDEMLAYTPSERPTAAELSRRLRSIRAQLRGPDLIDMAPLIRKLEASHSKPPIDTATHSAVTMTPAIRTGTHDTSSAIVVGGTMALGASLVVTTVAATIAVASMLWLAAGHLALAEEQALTSDQVTAPVTSPAAAAPDTPPYPSAVEWSS